MVQSSFPVPETYGIDLDHVRAMLQAEIQPEHQHESFELILGSLLLIQEHYGWISKRAAQVVAEHLRVPIARVYELLTFYGDFRMEVPGEHRLQVCDGTACHAMGTLAVRAALEAKLGIVAGETTDDGQASFDLIPTCLGVCDLAPLGLFDGKYYPKLTPATVGLIVDEVLSAPRQGGAHTALRGHA